MCPIRVEQYGVVDGVRGELIGFFDIGDGMRCAATRRNGRKIELEGQPEGGVFIDGGIRFPIISDDNVVLLENDQYAFGV